MAKRSTSTSAFGVSKRENHDASGFYRRFTAPELCSDGAVHPDKSLDKLIRADARTMSEVPDGSVALVVTSPPYFAGKEYEEALGQGGVPATYLEYLGLLRDVFAECVRTLEPGGRIAVNVANLGRRPYRSLSADVTGILQDDLRLLLRGEIIWLKQRGASGSCAWGSFQRPANPVLRDLTERVIVASKGRFDRAGSARDRARSGLPSEGSLTRDEFMEHTLDVWEIPPESATRVGHPAPFPVELPARLIDLYTYRGDLVLDPFAGSGTVAVAAIRAGRHYVGYDLDESYLELAETRVGAERDRLAAAGARLRPDHPTEAVTARWSRAVAEGQSARQIVALLLDGAGFTDVRENVGQPGGVRVDFSARDVHGRTWLFDVCGGLTSHRPGLRRAEVLWKALGKAAVLHQVSDDPFVLVSAGLPAAGSSGAASLRAVCGAGRPVHAVLDLVAPDAPAAFRGLCSGPRG